MDRKLLNAMKTLIGSVAGLYFSEIDIGEETFHQETTAPDDFDIFLFFALDVLPSLTQARKAVRNILLSSGRRRPGICTNSMGMCWISDFELIDNVPRKIHIIGPVFVDGYSMEQIAGQLDTMHLSLPVRKQFLSTVMRLPVIPLFRMYEYGMMLHYCLYQEKISMQDFETDASLPNHASEEPLPFGNGQGIYLAEQRVMDCIRDGNLQYQKALEQLSMVGQFHGMTSSDHMRKNKNYIISLITLCARASIEGGLSPAAAYRISSHYFDCAEAAVSPLELQHVQNEMLEEYVTQVHRLKNRHISFQIQNICDMIRVHPEKKYSLHELAEQAGYYDYYLSKKFKAEVGCSLKDFILQQKIEAAKLLLKSSNESIGSIAEYLNFSSQSYFSHIFGEQVGCTPQEFRGS